MRTLTEQAAAEAAKPNGARLYHVLKIEWGGDTGDKFYSDESLPEPEDEPPNGSPVEAAGIVLSWGNVQLEAQPDQTGGYGTCSLELADPDGSLRALFDTLPGPTAKRATINLHFGGTDDARQLTVHRQPSWLGH